MRICPLPVCLCLLSGIYKYWLDLPKKIRMGRGPTSIPINFESDLDHNLDAKKKKK